MSFDGYIRVSSRKGRSDERFLSPEIQRDTIARLAASRGLTLGEIVAEIDVSGGKRIDERELGRLVERIENGESDGLIVWKLSRFSRNLRDGVEAASRIIEAGGQLIAEDFDSRGPMAGAMLGLMTGLAEDERLARREAFRQARSRAIDRGAPCGRAPYGYRKLKDGRLEIVESKAKRVREAFELRALGVPFSQIASRLRWSHSTTRQRISDKTYLGVAWHGEFVNERAHPEIVGRELFARANAARTKQHVPPGTTTKDRLLIGLVRCAGCGHTLKPISRRRADGTRRAAYYCKDAASEPCGARAWVGADELDARIGEWFAATLQTVPRMVDVVTAGRELEAAQAEQAQAEAELNAYIENASALDAARFQRGLRKRQEAADTAVENVRHLSTRLTQIPAGGALSTLWGDFGPAERRDVLAGFLDRIEVSRGAGADLAGSLRIFWSDGTIANDEAGVRVAAA
jgi:DNA invertase Pin-like site-specific DNA recombinase